jgi:hypothetical protein
MNNADILETLFLRLRRAGFQLGLGELLDAQRALAGGWPIATPDDVLVLARLLFCDSLNDIRDLERIWAEIQREQPQPPAPSEREQRKREETLRREHERAATIERAQELTPPTRELERPVEPALAALPLLAPEPRPSMDEAHDLLHAMPLTRRTLTYAWRFLRRPVPDGPADVLDLPASVELAARRGFFLAPVLRRRTRNAAHLVLLIDQGGSMTPFHRLTRDIVDTARSSSGLDRVAVAYFRNVPAAEEEYNGPRPPLIVCADPHLTSRITLDELLAECDGETSLLVVSDAGAARGYRVRERIRRSQEFLGRLRERSALVTWLNPLPEARWTGTSAERIANSVPMFPPEPEALATAIDVLRGAPFRHI